MAATDARPVPRKNVAFRVVFPIMDADGDLVTAAATLDSEISKDQGTFADCTNEATEIATSSGMYYLDLTATEMNADCVAIIIKTSTAGAKTTAIVMYPEEAGDYRADVVQIAGATVSTTTAQLGVNVVQLGGTVQTAGDIMPSLGEENAAAATGDVSTTESLMQYIKQIINVLEGTPGITTWPAAAVPGNAISMAEVLRQVYDEVAGLNGATGLDAAGVRTAVGLASANLDTQLVTIDDLLDTEVGAIKTKTDQLVFTGSRVDSSVGAVQANAIADAGVSTDLDTYQAKVDIIDDNTGTTDRYVVCWFKNSQPVLASITVPTIQVWKASDGTDLIASTAMTEIGTTQTFKYDATTTARIISGAAYVAKMQATIDGATRTWVQVVGRDS